ncbi:hypothetical protein SME13J_02710 [Serratia marcescens]|nr:hypothetical protein SME13J_02710 [Serratia marcescens]
MQIDNIAYDFQQSNFLAAKNHALKLTGLLKNSLKMQDGNIDVDIGAILANLGSPEMRSIEEFVVNSLSVTDETGAQVLLRDTAKFNAHFNAHRSHYFPVMFEGVKFHFADFLPAGVGFAQNMSLTDLLKKA